MKVTNISVKLAPPSGDRLKAFCTMTLDDEFVVRDLKIIEGTSGLFVAMPSRKLTDHCPKCGGKNHLRAKFCNDCGARLAENRSPEEDAQGKLHADVAHPINSECRNRIQGLILDAFRGECSKEGRHDDAQVAAEFGGISEPAPVDGATGPATPEPQAEPAPPPMPEPQAEPAPMPEPVPEPKPQAEAAPEAGESVEPEQPADGGGEPEGGQGHIFGEGIL